MFELSSMIRDILVCKICLIKFVIYLTLIFFIKLLMFFIASNQIMLHDQKVFLVW